MPVTGPWGGNKREEKMDKEKFSAEVLAAEKSMYHIAKSIVGNDEDCADAMQNAILSAYTKLYTLKNEAYFKTWLTKILINQCYQLLREKKATVSYEDYMDGQFPDEYLQIEDEQCSDVFLEVMNLKEKYRIPFVLHYVEGYSVKEIAEMLDISTQNVKVRLYRSRDLLKDKLKGEYGYA